MSESLTQAFKSLGNIGTAVIIVTVTVVITVVAARVLRKALHSWLGGTALGEVSIVDNVIRVALLVIAAYFIGENVFHVKMDGVVQALGVTTLAISLGMQDVIKNVVAGFQIFMAHLFVVGDQIVLGGQRGEVMDINWRQTTIRDKDGNPHVIPNSSLMGESFCRLDGKMTYRTVISCDIKPGLDLSAVAADIERLAEETLDSLGYRAEGLSPEVRFVGSTANGVSASIRIYIDDIEHTTRSMDAVMRAIGQRGYLADWTNDNPSQQPWR